MFLRRLLIVVMLLIVTKQLAMARDQQGVASHQNSNKTGATPARLVGRFRGTLPCADCPGIDTKLALYTDSPSSVQHTRYVLTRTYLERKLTSSEKGTWSIVHGIPDDSMAIVYQLNANNGGHTYFLKIGDTELLQLDNDRRRIDTKLNLTLKKETGQHP